MAGSVATPPAGRSPRKRPRGGCPPEEEQGGTPAMAAKTGAPRSRGEEEPPRGPKARGPPRSRRAGSPSLRPRRRQPRPGRALPGFPRRKAKRAPSGQGGRMTHSASHRGIRRAVPRPARSALTTCTLVHARTAQTAAPAAPAAKRRPAQGSGPARNSAVESFRWARSRWPQGPRERSAEGQQPRYWAEPGCEARQGRPARSTRERTDEHEDGPEDPGLRPRRQSPRPARLTADPARRRFRNSARNRMASSKASAGA